MSYLNITKSADHYLKKIKASETHLNDILSNLCQSNKSPSSQILNPSLKELQLEYIKEYIKKKIKKQASLTTKKQQILKPNNSFEILQKFEKNAINCKTVEKNNKSIQVDLIKDKFKRISSSDISTDDSSIKRKTSLPALEKSNKKLIVRSHSRPKNPSEAMKNYYKYHVKLHFSPETSKTSLSPIKKSLKDFQKIKLFKIVE